MRRPFLLWLVLGMLSTLPAHAQVDAARLMRSLRQPRDPTTGAGRTASELPAFLLAEGRLSVLVRRGDRWEPFDGTPSAIDALEGQVDEVSWSPQLRPRLDQVGNWIHVGAIRDQVGGTGAGAVVGIIDTGIEARHPDLRDAAGKSRILYYLDFSRTSGDRPDLEEEYCEASGVECGVFSGARLDQLIANGIENDEPGDTIGHGTHVASIAAGNGAGSPGAGYVGVAPEATLIVARTVRPGGSIFESDVVRATRFVFEQAEALGMPAVVNVSLGTDFGDHDGSAPLEQALAALVHDAPGRALVVAAGNGGTVFSVPHSTYPEPFGLHTEVHVPGDTEARVPVLSPSDEDSITATLYVWVAFRPGDDLAVGLDRRSGPSISPISRGSTLTWESDEVDVTIYNEATSEEGIEVGDDAAVVIIDGTWSPTEVFAVRLEGHGTARLWVQSEGDLGPARSVTGAVFSAASVAGTVNIPATHPDLIAVGATINRDAWPTRVGPGVELDGLRLGTVAAFSAAGPTATGWMKPDVVAPGDQVIAAMAAGADPRVTGGGLFNTARRCDFDQCLVVDDTHAVSSGTSMAAPVVTGAIALLLARQPELRAHEVRALLQAGASRVEAETAPAAGAGALDVAASLAALEGGDATDGVPVAAASWIALADDLAHPDPKWPLRGLLQLRGSNGRPADGFSGRDLEVGVTPGDFVQRLRREAPGVWSFSIAAPSGTGGQTLEVTARLRGELLARRRIPIAVDRSVANGEVTARGGCSVPARPAAPLAGALALLVMGLVGRRRRRRETAPRARRCQGAP